MIIKKIAVGNRTEAFVEDRLNDSVNIVSSDDNNKGKTIIMQSLMYCLGNVPVFPSTFNYKDYYYVVEFEYEDNLYTICRKKDTFIIKGKDSIMFFDTVSEMKRYWSKTIFQLPSIIKNGVSRIVDPELFVQLFFVGQDKKDSSNIANKGLYKKTDFINMLYDYADLGFQGLSSEEIAVLKNKRNNLQAEKKTLLKEHKILKSKSTPMNYLSQHSDKQAFEEKIKETEKIKNRISDLRISRNSTINRRMKYDVTLKELKSLNRTISTGELHCLNCSSTHIAYSSAKSESYTFDVSTTEVRNQIINSIEEKIASYSEEIERFTVEINIQQEHLQEMLKDEDISLESVLLYKEDIIDATGVESKISSIKEEIVELTNAIKANDTDFDNKVQEQKELMSQILIEMNNAYKRIDPTGKLHFDNIFTTRSEVFSGSEATEFQLVKLYAFGKVLKHPFPIIVDSFRAEDLSTDREQRVIDLFNELNNQVIFTTTLKKEEIGKYNKREDINHIDYSYHFPNKILTSNALDDFLKLTKSLLLDI